MCGICCILNYGNRAPVDPELLERMSATMVHRGPDDSGSYIDRHLGLAMRRLSIIDLSTGHQPITNEDRTAWIVFNGEIYNYRELREELLAAGHTFTTHTDTEVILHGYEEWGDACLKRLNGIFGLAIWDAKRERLLLARDPFGVKPLYYRDDGARLMWASEVKAILADRTISPETNIEALDLFLTLRFVPSPWTMFRGFRKLRPGHFLVFENGSGRVERYFAPRPEPLQLSEREAEELLQTRLENAVRRQMISDVPVGALLSCGIDSASVVALMGRSTTEPVRTFTVGFRDHAEFNEIDQARQTAACFGTVHDDVLIDHVDYAEWLQRSIWHMEEPNGTTSALALFFVCRLARQSVKVVLTGQGVDEPMAGYHRYYAERYCESIRSAWPLVPDGLLRNAIEALPRLERLKRAARTIGITDTAQRFARIYAVFTPEMRAALWLEGRRADSRDRAVEIIDYWRQPVEGMHPLLQMCYVDARLSLADDLLMCADKMAMATSVELRVPFLDIEYMAAAEALPPELRIHGTTRKYIHKRAVRKWVPRSIIKRRKRGFETPIDRWLRESLVPFFRETVLARDSGCRQFFSQRVMEALLADHVAGRADYQRHLFSLLVFELWHRQFVAGSGAADLTGMTA